MQSPNHLIDEKSPYLLQHAYNPVFWYPWGEKAWHKALEEDKPVFLSIGYSTCHWCHVMEKESFEDQEVADFLNKHFIAIKVDREERPDVDQIYMGVCQALTGQGGWPLSVFLMPNKKPFFAGTYFPKRSKWGKPGFLDLLALVVDKWRNERPLILSGSEELTRALQTETDVPEGELLEETVEEAYRLLLQDFDAQHGGFGDAPKFPMPHTLLFLLRHWQRTGKAEALHMVEKTLQHMKAGGLYDHLGFGFSRYSVDAKWLIPHFEKMLYDNALLLYTYLEAYQITGKEMYAKTAREILQYVQEEMTDTEGGFYSAEDADSAGEEGKFYVWTQAEVMAELGPTVGGIFADYYQVTSAGNFVAGTNHLHHLDQDLLDLSAKWGKTEAEIEQILTVGRQRLLAKRARRIRPHKDDKILTAWNALMIAACAKASHVLQDASYREMAEQAWAFIRKNLYREDGRLLARYREGEAAYLAYLDDYAFSLWALIELYEATLDQGYLQQAEQIAEQLDTLFYDEKRGGYYFTAFDAEVLLIRPKEVYDGAMPSGNSVTVWSFLRLFALTKQERWVQRAQEMIKMFASVVSRYPRGYTCFLLAVEWGLRPVDQLVLLGQGDLVERMHGLLGQIFRPNLIVRQEPEHEQQGALLCTGALCHRPIYDLSELERYLKKS